jgi:hypothetical protein
MMHSGEVTVVRAVLDGTFAFADSSETDSAYNNRTTARHEEQLQSSELSLAGRALGAPQRKRDTASTNSTACLTAAVLCSVGSLPEAESLFLFTLLCLSPGLYRPSSSSVFER